jgi:hypothetical protein
MRQFTWGAALTILALASFVSSASAQTFNFPLDGLQEVPPTPSPGTGTCTVVVNDPANTVDVMCSYMGLLSPTNAAHIHAPAPPGMNASVIQPLVLNPPSATAGTINQTGLVLSETNIQHILAGNAYVNIHTNLFPGGEIRGQIVPEPASLGLLAIGALAVIRRRRAA